MTDQEKLNKLKLFAEEIRKQSAEIFEEAEEIEHYDSEELETIIAAEASDNIATQILDIINQ